MTVHVRTPRRRFLVGEAPELDEVAAALAALGHDVARGRADDPSVAGGVDAIVLGAREHAAGLDLRKQREMFIRMAVHDLKNPLATIVGNAEYLGQAPELSRDSRDSVADVIASASLLGRIVLELGDVDRGLDGPLVPARSAVDIGTLLGQITRDALPRATHRGVSLVLDTDLDPSPDMFDRDLVRRAIDTLVDNALKHAPPGSAVTLRAHARSGSVRVEIHDEGPSIADDELPRIFDRAAVFDHSGNGAVAPRALRRLAALFCMLVCEAHRGRAWAESPTSGGATFCLELPRR